MKTLSIFIPLFRPAIALFAGGAAATGRLAAAPHEPAEAAAAGLGVFLLACGASAINQIQERDIDGLMERTRDRPLPSGVLTPASAAAAAATALISGSAILGLNGRLPPVIGLLAVLWYNGLYTPLKRRTAFAAVYGAPVGMAAPAAGWAAGGGSMTDPRLIVLALLFLLWQVPHFWLLLLRSGDDYERAGLPTLVRLFSRERLCSLTAVWMAATAASSLLLPLFGLVRSPVFYALLLASCLLPAFSAVRMIRNAGTSGAAPFRLINGFIAAVMLLIAAETLLSR